MTRVKSNKVCFTLNNYSEEELQTLEETLCKLEEHLVFAIIGLEIGENGTPHVQGYIRFKTDFLKAKDGMLKFWRALPGLGRAHFETARGTDNDSFVYCSKEGPFRTWGEPSPGDQNPYEKILELCCQGDLQGAMQVDPEITIR